MCFKISHTAWLGTCKILQGLFWVFCIRPIFCLPILLFLAVVVWPETIVDRETVSSLGKVWVMFSRLTVILGSVGWKVFASIRVFSGNSCPYLLRSVQLAAILKVSRLIAKFGKKCCWFGLIRTFSYRTTGSVKPDSFHRLKNYL